MKRRELLQRLEAVGFRLIREGAKHTIYGRGDHEEAIPRHRECNEQLARAILRRTGADKQAR